MPAGALTVMWVPQLHSVLTQYHLGWNYVAAGDVVAMASAVGAKVVGPAGAVPARNLPPIVRSTFIPVARVATPPPGRPSAP